MRILGIETSCDETSAAVVEDGVTVRSNVVATQIPAHERFGGVVPEIASRQHILAISAVTREALDASKSEWDDINGIAVTYGPGLSGPLLVGVNFAKGLAIASNVNLFRVNHVEGHLLSTWLSSSDEFSGPPTLPMVALVVSGGHTELVLVRSPGTYQILGRTIDDAAGEAFDKVGRLLGLPYPGGPSLETAAAETSDHSLQLPRAWLPGSYDFSFSGLKTASVRMVRAAGENGLDPGAIASIAWAFQDSVADVLTAKLAQAVEVTGAQSASIVGGVANNRAIRRLAEQRLRVPVHFPDRGLSSDNAAMIAGATFWHPDVADYSLDAAPSLSLDST